MVERFRDQPLVDGWISLGPSVANWGTDYILRGALQHARPGWNLPADAVYPVAERGPDGRELDGSRKYVIRFPPGQMPPVNGFWSLTMYDADRFLVPNPLSRYT